MGVMFALFHARGTLACVIDLLNKLVTGVSSWAQHSLSSRVEISSRPTDLFIYYLNQSFVNIYEPHVL